MSDLDPDDVVAIEIRGLPVRLYRSAAEHHDELRREFALIHQSQDPHSVPARLETLIGQLDARFGTFTAQPMGVLHDAVLRGDERIDLVYQVPRAAGPAALELEALLDEADAFCRAGEHLLTQATPGAPLAFRRWFLQEFVSQVQGHPPVSWDQHAAKPGRPTA